MVANPSNYAEHNADGIPGHGSSNLDAMKSVLVALDGSTHSLAALEQAVIWAKLLGARLHGVFVEDEWRFLYYPSAASFNEEATRGAALHDTVNKYFGPHGIEPAFQTARGKPAKEIIKVAEGSKAGLIVMGVFGHGPIRQLVFGRSTLVVLENTPCPVLLMV